MIGALLAVLLTVQSPKVVSNPFPVRDRRDTTANYIVLHYDSGASPASTFRYLRKKRLSYHYYISRNGTIYKLVDPKYRANHAGLSAYDGKLRMNKYSIGICFQNKSPELYTDAQYESAAWLINVLYGRFPESRTHKIVGHSDIAFPRGRKKDPGEHFSWDKLHDLMLRP